MSEQELEVRKRFELSYLQDLAGGGGQLSDDTPNEAPQFATTLKRAAMQGYDFITLRVRPNIFVTST